MMSPGAACLNMCEQMFGGKPTWRYDLAAELQTSKHVLDQWFSGVRPMPILVMMHLRMRALDHYSEIAQRIHDLDATCHVHEQLHMIAEAGHA